MDLCNINEIKSLLARHGFRFSKSMGQNFLIADWVPREIAKASRTHPDAGVLEIGPGIGCLTQELAGRAGKVVSVELDKALLPILEETLAGRDNVEIVPGDILKLDIRQMTRDMPWLSGFAACANLPYNITTPVLRVLASCGRFEAMTVMIQREVALRLAARPGTGDYGAFTVFMQYYSQPEILFDVPPDCFLPAPKVTSAVVRCRMRQTPAVSPACGQDFFFRTVRAAFAQRRKTLANSLASVFGLGRERIAGAISACGLSPTVRGEVLGLEELANLADRLWEMTGEQDP